ncbi:sigma 54-interacting transcriptional regulator [Idiomarina xiamenensis]|uniref:Transcriptional activator of acetoin/glycerol metabolism n=1 Tax=Idiomarina xiamenensis 10-D-4 TaxID=740709 RepID=K2KM08_9GAMM|nr:sigma-54 dependent transcriptional regulator [Idiomarina xiamenensis]EKE87582.1 transcriptional activator of acetoin/glycerol metabolism [Idiomarina xiamenensis 10-D-4]
MDINAQTQTQVLSTRHADSSSQSDEQLYPTLVIMLHPQLERIGESAILVDLMRQGRAPLSRNQPEFKHQQGFGQALADAYISRTPVWLERRGSDDVVVKQGDSNTRLNVSDRASADEYILTQDELLDGVPITLSDRVVLLLKWLPMPAEQDSDDFGLKGMSPYLASVRRRIARIAGLQEPVLIRGETGTGKELVAQAIYQHSQRQQQAFVSVNLAAMQDSLAVAELFGARKGAFTGAAADRDGYFMAADGGTLFLDEIGEASGDVQAMLLRALETGEIYPVGSTSPVQISVRLIAATDADLETASEHERFKLPLLHRLSSYQIFLPSLRERREDIGLLFMHFAQQQWQRLHQDWQQAVPTMPTLTAAAMTQLLEFSWPGNVRQLRNVARQVVIDSRDKAQLQIEPQLLSMLRPAASGHHTLTARPPQQQRRKPNSISREELAQALQDNRFELQACAEQLGISRASVYQLLQRFDGFRNAQDIGEQELSTCYRQCHGDTEQMMWQLEVSQIGLRRRLKALGYDV